MIFSSLPHILFPVIIAVTLCMELSSSQAVTSYHIGNSLTNQNSPDAFELFAQSRGVQLDIGYSIRGTWALNDFLENPDDPTIQFSEHGNFATALPNNQWDIVTLQPHRNFPGTQMHQDVSSILTYIDLTRSNPANADTNFYIYQTWPELSGNYQTTWTTPLEDHPNVQSTRSRDYFNHLIERVRAETDANVYMIPAGEVFYELDKKIRSKEIPGYSSVNNFYGDAVHMRPETGRYISSMVMYATMMGQYPNELEKPEGYFTGPQIVTAQQEAMFQEVIRDVIHKSPYSGVELPPRPVSDFNLDGVVDERDLEILAPSIGITDPYDLNDDGNVNGRDFLTWQRSFRGVLSPAEAAQFAYLDLDGNGIVDETDIRAWQDAYSLNDEVDHDGDGDIDGRDFLIWQRNFPLNNAVDLDGDGDTDGRDFLIWQRSYRSWPGDLNSDFLVDAFELEAWQDSYGFTLQVDANGDGVVDLADYEIWESQNGLVWTFPFAPSSPLHPSGISGLNSVPEPGTLVSSAVALLCVLSRRRTVR